MRLAPAILITLAFPAGTYAGPWDSDCSLDLPASIHSTSAGVQDTGDAATPGALQPPARSERSRMSRFGLLRHADALMAARASARRWLWTGRLFRADEADQRAR